MAEPVFLDKQEEEWRLPDRDPPAGERTRCRHGRRDGPLWRAALRLGLAVLAVFGICGLLVRSLGYLESHHHHPSQSHHYHPSSDSCGGPDRYNLLSNAYPVEAGAGSNISIVQRIARHHPGNQHGRFPHVRGTLDVRPSSSPPRITLDVVLNDEAIPVSVVFDHERQALTVTTPWGLPSWEGPYEPCVEVRAVVHLPPGSELGALSLRAVSLAVSLEDGLGLRAAGVSAETVGAGVALRRGALVGARSVSLRSVAGDIDAEVPAAEVVRAETTSGAISLRLVPAADDPGRPQTTCSLAVSTVSGRVDVREERELPLTLEYSHSVRSVSGDIRVALPFTTESSVGSTSGGITAVLAPVFGDGPRGGSLRTETVSGGVDVTVGEPRGGGGGKLDGLVSRHKGMSGAQRLRYPRAWEGRFAARSMVGRVGVEGKDVRVRKGRRGGVEGEKGEGGSRLEVTSMSGDIGVVIGDV